MIVSFETSSDPNRLTTLRDMRSNGCRLSMREDAELATLEAREREEAVEGRLVLARELVANVG